MTQENNNPSLEQEEAPSQYDIADNASIILGWMLVGILILFAAISVALHDPVELDVVNTKPVNIQNNATEGSQIIPAENKPQLRIEDEGKLIHTQLSI